MQTKYFSNLCRSLHIVNPLIMRYIGLKLEVREGTCGFKVQLRTNVAERWFCVTSRKLT